MRGPQIYGLKFHPKGGVFKFTDLNFIQTEGPQIFKKFLQWSKNKSKMRSPKFTDVNFIQEEGPPTFFHRFSAADYDSVVSFFPARQGSEIVLNESSKSTENALI
jgi:hypothetical protein